MPRVIVRAISTLRAGADVSHTPLVRCSALLSFTSLRSKRRATCHTSPATMPDPTKKVPQPGPGKGAKTRLPIAMAVPKAM